MCRRPIYFKGFHKVEEQWNEDAWETRCSEIFEHAIEDAMQDLQFMLTIWPKDYHAFFMRKTMREFRKTERMFSAMKECGFASDDIDYVINETDVYFAKPEKVYIVDSPVYEKVPYTSRSKMHKAMRFKKNNVR
jgi:hypothetical protein